MKKVSTSEAMWKIILIPALTLLCASCSQQENFVDKNDIIFSDHRNATNIDATSDLPERMRNVGVGVWVDGYAVDFGAHKIIRTEYLRDTMFDAHGFEHAKSTNFNNDCYVKTVDDGKRTVILVSAVELGDVDAKNIVPLVDFLWRTDEKFFYPASDTWSNLWLRDGQLVKSFTSPAFPPKSQPATLTMLVEEIYNKKTQHCH